MRYVEVLVNSINFYSYLFHGNEHNESDILVLLFFITVTAITPILVHPQLLSPNKDKSVKMIFLLSLVYENLLLNNERLLFLVIAATTDVHKMLTNTYLLRTSSVVLSASPQQRMCVCGGVMCHPGFPLSPC